MKVEEKEEEIHVDWGGKIVESLQFNVIYKEIFPFLKKSRQIFPLLLHLFITKSLKTVRFLLSIAVK